MKPRYRMLMFMFVSGVMLSVPSRMILADAHLSDDFMAKNHDHSDQPSFLDSMDETGELIMTDKMLAEAEEEFELRQHIRLQTIKELEDGIKIDDAFLDAKKIEVQRNIIPVENKKEDIVTEILTEEEIIAAVISPDLRSSMIDLDFDEVILSDIFRTLGKAAKLNVVLDPAIKNQMLDLHLMQVTLEEAFMLISNAYDLGFKKVGNSLFVTSKDKIKDENAVSKIIKLRNISVQEAESLMSDVIPEVSISEELNSLIVVGTPNEINAAMKIIREIDKPQLQVVLEANIIEVNKDALKDVGVDWSDQLSVGFRETGQGISFDDPESNNNFNLFKTNSFNRTALDFTTVFKFLERQNKAKILSNPRISTLNDKEAEIFVGDRVPYTITTITGGVATTEVRFVEPGIRLMITPSIIENDFVVLKVEPEVSFISAFKGPNDEYPQVKTREATAYVRVKDQQPFVLGGLLTQEDREGLSKVPVLGDLPLFGNLFTSENHTLINTELIITVKPTIVGGDS